MREQWLNLPEWIERVPEVVVGYPERILINLYNKKPAWLWK
ncbi:hypothetical protein [Chromatium okenii]|nr:hypothetical protein [Chromatium okenii]